MTDQKPKLATRALNLLFKATGREMVVRNKLLEAEVATLRARVIELEKQSTTDTLTELPNRRALEHALPRMASDAVRDGKVLVIAFIDADRFKKVNDTLGHDAGDQVLRHIAKSAVHAVRDTDLVARYGGEEFVLLAKCTDHRHGLMLADKVRKHIEATPCVLDDDTKVPVTISSGVAVVDKDMNVQSAMKYADEAVYAAKGMDRNCVVYHPGHGEMPVRVLESAWDKDHLILSTAAPR